MSSVVELGHGHGGSRGRFSDHQATLQRNKILRMIEETPCEGVPRVAWKCREDRGCPVARMLLKWRSRVTREIPLERIVEQITDVHVPQIMEEIVEVAKIVLEERVQLRTAEEIVDVPVPQFLEEIVEVICHSTRSASQRGNLSRS